MGTYKKPFTLYSRKLKGSPKSVWYYQAYDSNGHRIPGQSTTKTTKGEAERYCSECLKPGTRKDTQAELIEQQIGDMLPLRGITQYRLIFISGKNDQQGLASVGEAIASATLN